MLQKTRFIDQLIAQFALFTHEPVCLRRRNLHNESTVVKSDAEDTRALHSTLGVL